MITELQTELVPIDSLKLFKGNARVGDVGVIRESLRVNGQYRPLVVRKRTSEILAGNHTWKAAKEEGYTKVWVTFIDCDAKTAKRINLVDNRAAELGTYDEGALVSLLGELPSLEGTGWDGPSLQELVGKLSPPSESLSNGDSPPVPEDDYEGQLGVIVLCLDQPQQQGVFEALQALVTADPTFDGAKLKIVAI